MNWCVFQDVETRLGAMIVSRHVDDVSTIPSVTLSLVNVLFWWGIPAVTRNIPEVIVWQVSVLCCGVHHICVLPRDQPLEKCIKYKFITFNPYLFPLPAEGSLTVYHLKRHFYAGRQQVKPYCSSFARPILRKAINLNCQAVYLMKLLWKIFTLYLILL